MVDGTQLERKVDSFVHGVREGPLIESIMASVGSLEEQARTRKERLRALANLSRKAKGDETAEEKHETESTEKEKLPR